MTIAPDEQMELIPPNRGETKKAAQRAFDLEVVGIPVGAMRALQLGMMTVPAFIRYADHVERALDEEATEPLETSPVDAELEAAGALKERNPINPSRWDWDALKARRAQA